jgi:phospholipid/cholesterol/gamma-HCH transport system substrate-binding protein
MSRETKIGLLSVIVIAVVIWGYMFLKGRNLLSKSKTYTTVYENVTDLNISSPVLLNGFKIGTITDIKPDPENVKQMVVYFVVEGDYNIPKNALAVMYSANVMGGKAISIEYEKTCSGSDCAANNARLEGKVRGLLDSMLGTGEMDEYTSKLTVSARNIIANIGKEGEKGPVNETVRQLEIISKNLAELSYTSNKLIEANARNIEITLANIAKVSQGLAKSNQNIEQIIKNLDKVTGDLAKADVQQSFGKMNNTMDAATVTIGELKGTLSQTTQTLGNLQGILKAIETGDGTASKLIYDKNLYQNLNTTSRELSLLLQDLRLNPKRYAHFSLFGKSQRSYTLPADDPAKEK